MTSETQFLEANALLSLIRGDESEARAALKQMNSAELMELVDAASRLHRLARAELSCGNSSRSARHD